MYFSLVTGVQPVLAVLPVPAVRLSPRVRPVYEYAVHPVFTLCLWRPKASSALLQHLYPLSSALAQSQIKHIYPLRIAYEQDNELLYRDMESG